VIARRNPATPRIKSVRVLTRDDLVFLQEKRATPALKRIRSAHRQLARLLFLGRSNYQIAEELGYTYSRVSLLAHDPAVKEMVARFHESADKATVELGDTLLESVTTATRMAMRQIVEQLEDADEEGGEKLPVNRLLAIAESGLDRIGHGKKSTTLNLNVDFAARLEAARRRAVPVIDAEAAHGDEAA
jgi:hypothetical protein